jgi:hypothetical protein
MDIAAELRDLAARTATGYADVVSGQVTAQIWVSEGRMASVTLSCATPALGMRLVSGGKLSLSHLGEALAAQQQNPQMRLGDVLVRMGLVSRQDVEEVAWEQMCDDVATLLGLPEPAFSFTPVAVTAVPAAGPLIGEVLAAAGHRISRWHEVVRNVGGPDTVPALTDAMLGTRDTTLRPEEWAVLCRIDGRRSLMSIAQQAGFTTLEAASILQGLLAAGLVTVPPVMAPAPPPAPPVVVPAPDLFDDPTALLRELSELGGDATTRRRGR